MIAVRQSETKSRSFDPPGREFAFTPVAQLSLQSVKWTSTARGRTVHNRLVAAAAVAVGSGQNARGLADEVLAKILANIISTTSNEPQKTWQLHGQWLSPPSPSTMPVRARPVSRSLALAHWIKPSWRMGDPSAHLVCQGTQGCF